MVCFPCNQGNVCPRATLTKYCLTIMVAELLLITVIICHYITIMNESTKKFIFHLASTSSAVRTGAAVRKKRFRRHHASQSLSASDEDGVLLKIIKN